MDYSYDYPTENIATVWSVFNEGTYDDKDGQDFEVFYNTSHVTLNSATRIICSDCDDAYYEGTYIVTDPTIWDMKFYLSVSYKLAAAMAGVLTGDTEKGLKLMQVYNAILGEAKRIGASEQKKKPPRKSSYQSARG